jgi:hypothetical protein
MTTLEFKVGTPASEVLSQLSSLDVAAAPEGSVIVKIGNVSALVTAQNLPDVIFGFRLAAEARSI